MRISDWSSDVCSSDLGAGRRTGRFAREAAGRRHGGAARPVRPLSEPRLTRSPRFGTPASMFSIAPTIETDRLRLRPGRLTDKDVHIAMWADARVTRFIGGEPRSADVSWGKFLSSAGLWPVMGFGYWVFADRASDALIGMGGLSYFCRGITELEEIGRAHV